MDSTVRFTCPECLYEVGSDDVDPHAKPSAWAGSLYCSRGCRKAAKRAATRHDRALRDLRECAARLGWTNVDCWNRAGPHPIASVVFPWGRAKLRLGSRRHEITTCLHDWSQVTGKPIPPPRTLAPNWGPGWNPDDPPGAMSQPEWDAMLSEWLEGYAPAREAVAKWNEAQVDLGIFDRWAVPGAEVLR
jgi:hypothetical protein